MKILVLFCNFLLTQADTIIVDYGDKKFMEQDSIVESIYQIKKNLPDGIYLIMDKGSIKFKKQVIEIKDSTIIVEISFYENSDFSTSKVKDESKFQFPPIESKYELLEGNISKDTEYYINGNLRSIGIFDWNLEKQQLVMERRHFRNGSLEMTLEKIENSDRYQVKYFYESGELYVFGQFDEYNRPSGIWTYFYENGKKKEEGPVCTECIQKIWRPWTLFLPVYRQGLWTYYSKDGAVIKTVEKNER